MIENVCGFNRKWVWLQKFAHDNVTEPSFKKSCICHCYYSNWYGFISRSKQSALPLPTHIFLVVAKDYIYSSYFDKIAAVLETLGSLALI